VDRYEYWATALAAPESSVPFGIQDLKIINTAHAKMAIGSLTMQFYQSITNKGRAAGRKEAGREAGPMHGWTRQ